MRRGLLWMLALAGLTVVIAYVGTSMFVRESPNYSQIEPGLWIGGRVASPPPSVRVVVNLCEVDDEYRVESYRWEPIRDAAPAPDLEWLRSQVAFIQRERAAGRTVFVHCRNGVSRSGMVVVAYLMQSRDCSRDEALEIVRRSRPMVRPNPAFLELLGEWERALVQNPADPNEALNGCD